MKDKVIPLFPDQWYGSNIYIQGPERFCRSLLNRIIVGIEQSGEEFNDYKVIYSDSVSFHPVDHYFIISDSPVPQDMLNTIKAHTIDIVSTAFALGYTSSQHEIQNTDWQILRELERKFLTDHPLHAQREQWRKQVDEEIASEAINAEQ